MLVEREVGHQEFESGVIFFHPLKPAEITHAQVGYFFFQAQNVCSAMPKEVADGGVAVGTAEDVEIHSFCKGPSKLSLYSRFRLPSFSEKT